jgi:MFS transporter, PPP family, 3-phenylpropionic acid transporter
MNSSFRTSLYYFSQFWSGGAFHAYGGIWFASLGFTATQIGLANTVPTLIMLLTNIFVGKLADRAKDWRQVLMICGLISTVFSAGLIFSTSFLTVFFFWSVALIMQTIAVPVGDAAATYLAREGRGSIGTMRSLSTLGYIASLFVTGFIMQGYGGGAFALIFACFTAFRGLSAFALPAFKSDVVTTAPKPTVSGARQFLSPWLLFPLLGWAIVYATLQVLNSFLALILKKQGIAEGTIGWLLAWGALTEAVVFYTFARFSKLLDLRWWIIISCGVTALRWIAMANEPSMGLLIVLQSLHGISFALGFVACVSHIAKHTSHTVAAEAQSAFNVIQMMSAVVVVTLFGVLLDRLGAKAFYISALIALLGTLIAVSALRFNPPEPTAPDRSASPPSPA